MKTKFRGRSEFLGLLALYLFGMTNLPKVLSFLIVAGLWLASGGSYLCYLALNTAQRDFHLLVRGLKLLLRMAYIKMFNVNIVRVFRSTLSRYPNRVMYVNAASGAEWTYSKAS